MAEAPRYLMIQPRGEADLPKNGASVVIRGKLYTRHSGAYHRSGRKNEWPIPVKPHGQNYTRIDADQSLAVARDRARRFDRTHTAATTSPSRTAGPPPPYVPQVNAPPVPAGPPPPYTSGPGPTGSNALHGPVPNTVGSRAAVRDLLDAGARFVRAVIESLMSRFGSMRRNERSREGPPRLVDQHSAVPQWPLAQSAASHQGQDSPPPTSRWERQLPQQYNSTRAPYSRSASNPEVLNPVMGGANRYGPPGEPDRQNRAFPAGGSARGATQQPWNHGQPSHRAKGRAR